jgi:hypothetical protein
MKYRMTKGHFIFAGSVAATLMTLGMASCAHEDTGGASSGEILVDDERSLSNKGRTELLMQRHLERLSRSPTNDVSGRVLALGDAPIGDVTVRVGKLETKTNADGSYRFVDVPLGHHVVTFEHPGYVLTQRHVVVQQGAPAHFDGRLLPRSKPRSFNADEGAHIVEGPLALEFEPGDLSFEDGEPVHGEVEVIATVVDPRQNGHLEAAPAQLEGITTEGDLVGLTSYGMLEVELSQAGRKVNVKRGETVTTSMSLGNDYAVNQGDGIPMWHLDTARGVWAQEPGTTAKVEQEQGGFVATADLPHFSSWNYDTPADATCATIPFSGTPTITNFRVVSTDASGNMDPVISGQGSRWWFNSTCDTRGARSTCITNVPSGAYGSGVYFKFQAQNPSTGSWSDVSVTLNGQVKTVLQGSDVNTWLSNQGKPSGNWCGAARPQIAYGAYIEGEFQLGSFPPSMPSNRVAFGEGRLANNGGRIASSDPGFDTMRTNSTHPAYLNNYDRDGAFDGADGCPANSNPHYDANGNNIGDLCEAWCYVPYNDPYWAYYDYDHDEVDDLCDNAYVSYNPSQYSLSPPQ